MKHPWWGGFSVPEGESGYWRIGPLELLISRRANEWRLSINRMEENQETPVSVEIPAEAKHLEESGQLLRFGFSRASESVQLVPALPDRAVVINPVTPLSLLPMEEISLYISLPLWVQIQLGGVSQTIYETPTSRPSDTWFGPSTREGELCYGLKSRSHLRLEDLSARGHRAISVIRIVNQAPTPLPLERLRLPILQLSLYASREGHLWTDVVVLGREKEDEVAALDLAQGPPREARGAKLVGGPRVQPEAGLLVWAFGGIFDLGGML